MRAVFQSLDAHRESVLIYKTDAAMLPVNQWSRVPLGLGRGKQPLFFFFKHEDARISKGTSQQSPHPHTNLKFLS